MGRAGKSLAIAVAFGTLAAGGSIWASRYQPRQDAASQHVDFNRDIRPIFNAHCITCHGGVKQAGGVSFSYREQALGKAKSGRPIVVPGNPRASEMISRITSRDPEYRMPLHQQPLNDAQIALLRRWISQGAPWENYWAFVPPKPQALPQVQHSAWVRQPLDRFILARLEKDHLAPAPEAGKAELLRRVSLDLTGLPPTPKEIAAFLSDTSADAYEKQVDRLLASPAYGERWASMWLDLARYGDSKGFEKDRSRPGVWTYRDWVIRAFNSNMAYDRFVITQMAGDLLPHPTMDDLIATSFHRQTQANDEGGTDDEEFRLAAVMDRAATTWSVLNGVSYNCVQCHSHPYDPIRHVEYYKFLAFFNTSRDADMAFDTSMADDWPVLRVPADRKNYDQALQLQEQIAALRQGVADAGRSTAQNSHWTQMAIQSGTVSEILAIQRALAEREARGDRKESMEELRQRLVVATREKAPRAGFKIHDGLAEKTGTVPINSVFEFSLATALPRLTALRIEVPPADPVKARHSPEKGFVVNRTDLWAMAPDGQAQKINIHFLAPDSAENLEANFNRLLHNRKTSPAQSQMMTQLAAQSGFMANPSLFRTAWMVIVPDAPVTLAPGTRLKLQLTQTEPINAESSPPPRLRFAASGDDSWTGIAGDPTLQDKIVKLDSLQRQLQAMASVPLPVMAELAAYERRPTLEFDRGSFLTPIGPDLAAGTPALFPKFPDGAPRNRLTLAKWFFGPDQPLTARVAVNRFWEQLYGTGIVETLEDFGSAGELPSHPQLLDWLALHFAGDLHWNMKALLREMVTSATYRQSARTTAALRATDPRNRLLAHGPAQRLTAEMVRDQTLLASGLLNPAMGGPPVMPEQPEGIWNTVANNPERWKNATGADRYRRAIYTYIKRTAIYPSFVTFDAAERQLSSPRRIATNTPLQALITLNDPVFYQAAQALAARMDREAPPAPGDRLDNQLNFGARLVLSRDLSAPELKVLRGLHDKAGMTAVASALFNLDAALTR
jgi:mono/diheme cytochrome c family protein